MSDTRRKHESRAKRARRGPKNKMTDEMLRGVRKSPKQQRPNERARLRKEWL